MDFRGKTSLITGASSGLGRAFAEALAARGSDVVLVARSGAVLAELACRLRDQDGVRAEAVVADLAVAGAAGTIRRATDELGLAVDVLVNNAGFGSLGRFHTISAARSGQEVTVDVAAVVDLAHAYLPDMVARGDGALINVASTGAFQPVPYMAVYGASKAFVLSFSEALWAEYRSSGVRVLALCPGPVDTGFVAAVGNPKLSRRGTVGRPATAESVVRAALRALERGHPQVTPGLANAPVPLLNRLAPRRAVLHVMHRMYGGMQGSTEPSGAGRTLA